MTIGVADYARVEIQTGLKPGELVALEQPPSKVLEALGKEGEKKYSASMMPGARTGPASAAKPLTNTLSAKTNLIAATTNRSSTAGVKQ